jgi:hypothetical protein
MDEGSLHPPTMNTNKHKRKRTTQLHQRPKYDKMHQFNQLPRDRKLDFNYLFQFVIINFNFSLMLHSTREQYSAPTYKNI